jgi:hypothetical protein
MSLAKKTKTALDESRMLMLGAQILLGFQMQAPFQNAFSALTASEKIIEVVVLALMVVVIGLLIAPSARHRIVENGNATPGINRFITVVALITLLPFSLALALDLFIAGTRIGGVWTGIVCALATFTIACAFWYGPYAIRDNKRASSMSDSNGKTSAADKINYVLTEARVVLPGAQALLGFQLAIVLTSGFAELAPLLKWAHGAAIGMIMITTVLLMTPASYHRIVYEGADAPEFYDVASRFLLTATVFLALGLGIDIYVVVQKIGADEYLSISIAIASAVFLLGLWHAWPWLARSTANV